MYETGRVGGRPYGVYINNKIFKGMSKYKFNIGDRVKIVKYGHLMVENKNTDCPLNFPIIYVEGKYAYKDTDPLIVGQKGVVVERTKTQEVNQYALHGPNKYAWYDEEQIERLATEHKS